MPSSGYESNGFTCFSPFLNRQPHRFSQTRYPVQARCNQIDLLHHSLGTSGEVHTVEMDSYKLSDEREAERHGRDYKCEILAST